MYCRVILKTIFGFKERGKSYIMKNLIIHTHNEILFALQIEEDKMDWTCSTRGKNDDDVYKMFIGSH